MKKQLEDIIKQSNSALNSTDLPTEIKGYLATIGNNCLKLKGVYTVLTTLLYYKYLHPEQDIRMHRNDLPNGFSGRSFDTYYVTPVLTRLGLPAMSESGWLTRSLEQAHPFDFNFPGKISGDSKLPFLKSLDYVQKNPNQAYAMLVELFKTVNKVAKANQVKIVPLQNPEKLTIQSIMGALEEHFLHQYGTHNGAKLPVLAFYAIYSSLIQELKRYEGCSLAQLSSLTACDRTNKASGDIEIFKNGKLFEAIEIKLDKKIDSQIVRVVESKIYKWNPQRYYILSVLGTEISEQSEINNLICKIGINHGCQVINNGLLPTIKYYLRLISDLSQFLNTYSFIVEKDKELQPIHKQYWNELIKKYKL